jgi:hypothetical protein
MGRRIKIEAKYRQPGSLNVGRYVQALLALAAQLQAERAAAEAKPEDKTAEAERD